MSRLKNFSRNLASSYLQLGVNVVYSLVSVPLILYWLPKAEFGMWAVLVQLMGYISLIDMGMTAAVSRLLVDHKDERHNGHYGSLVKTAFLVSLIQGLIILIVVTVVSPLLATLMKIPLDFQSTFVTLMRWQGVLAAISFSLRPLSLILVAHQRSDICSVSEVISMVFSLGLLLGLLINDCGIYSFVYAASGVAVLPPVWLYWNCLRLGLLPFGGEWGQASWRKFTELFNYGKDVFLFSLGGQLVMSSQTIIVSRVLGLEMAAVWAVGTKTFNLCMPLLLRPLFVSLPALAEMMVRQESGRLQSRFKDLVVMISSLGAFLGISYVLCNSLFVGLWTHDRIIWPPANDALLATWMLVIAMQTVHCNFLFVTKQIRGGRYILFAEGVVFVLLAAWAGSHWGVPGIAASSILSTAAFSYQYSLRRSRDYFNCTLGEVALDWVIPSLKLAIVYGAFAAILWTASAGISSLPRLCLHATVAVTAGGILFLRLGCPPDMVRELSEHLPSSISKLLKHLILPSQTLPSA